MFNSPSTARFWLFYFNVDEINAGARRIAGAGGTIRQGPMQVPGGSWVAQAADPQGAAFAVMTPPK
jgi:predicted enzyme related to lactoylglutathione lyase